MGSSQIHAEHQRRRTILGQAMADRRSMEHQPLLGDRWRARLRPQVRLVTSRPMQVLCATSGEKVIGVRQWWLPWRRVRLWWCSCCGAGLPSEHHPVYTREPAHEASPSLEASSPIEAPQAGALETTTF